MVKIDIIVPCYNYGRYLPDCVGSVLGQSLQDLRVLIIDDASADDTLATASRLAEADKRVCVISHSQNCGHIKTYNEGVEWASADYIMLLSADDMLAPGALQRATAILDHNPDVVLVHGDAIAWQENLPSPVLHDASEYLWTRQDLIRESCTHGTHLVQTSSVIGRTSVQKAVGGYRAHLPHAGDMEMWLRYAARGTVAYINAVQTIYRLHSHNMSKLYTFLSDYEQRREVFASFFAEYRDRVPNSGYLHAMAECAMAERAFWSGIKQILLGRFESGRGLLRFGIALRPRLRYRPPVSYLLVNGGQRRWGASWFGQN